MLQERPKPDSSTFLGSGKIVSLAAACAETDADVVIFDDELTPAQLRHIEAAVQRKIIDRTQLILDIFARRARTREGKLQVELAQLKYLLPRLVGAGAALSRLGGGIGTRGPGETKLETDRRRIRTRIHAVSEDIEQVRQRRAQLRERRHKASVPTVALVGYTNAGKTTLFNALARADAEASNALFVTLDPLVRQVRLPDNRELLVSDTVGFIDRLPHALVAAFRATLEEVADADLVLHVIDAAATDRDRRDRAVHQVLQEVGANDVPILEVLQQVRRHHGRRAPAAAGSGSGRLVYLGAAAGGRRRADRHARVAPGPRYSPDHADVRSRTSRPTANASPGSTGTAACSSMRRGTAASRSSPTCRDGSSAASNRGNIFRMRRLACFVLLTTVAACARPPAPVVTPVVARRRNFPSSSRRSSRRISPGQPAAANHDLGWRLLQAGDLKNAEREFNTALKTAPAFYPAEAALGWLEIARKDAKAALPHFDRALERQPKDLSSLVGRGQALLGAESGIRRADGVRGGVGRRSVAAGLVGARRGAAVSRPAGRL